MAKAKVFNDVRADIAGWQNLATGLGRQGYDRTVNTEFKDSPFLSQFELEAIYKKNGIGKRIIDLNAKEMTREWFTVKNDTDGLITNYLKIINAKKCITDALTWARLYGGAIILLGIDDGGDFQDPVNPNTIKSIPFLHVFDRWRAIPQLNYQDAPDNETYGKPVYYLISPLMGTSGSFYVHHTRILRFDGEKLPPIQQVANLGWGNSVVESIYQELKNWGSSYGYTANIIADFVLAIINLQDLTSLLSAKNGETTLLQRAGIFNVTRATTNTVILDAEEKFNKVSSNVSGLSNLLDQFAKALSAVTGIPLTLLMGQSPGGLNATGDSDIRLWYDNIKKDQEDLLQPQLEKLINYILLSRDSPLGKKGLSNWKVNFNPLWQMSLTEKAQAYFQMAQGDNLYVQSGVLHPDEVAVSRFGGGEYSTDIKLLYSREPGDGLPPAPEDDEQPQDNNQPDDNKEQDDLKEKVQQKTVSQSQTVPA